MKLNDRQIKNAKPAEKPFKLNDGKGLYLYINTSGGKLWRFDFSYNGKRKTLSIGKYPTISLVDARQAAENARCLHLRPTFIYNHLYINNFIQYYILLFPVSRLFPFTQIYPNRHKNVGAFVGAWHNASKKHQQNY